MNKDPSHRPSGRFSSECCAKNTHGFGGQNDSTSCCPPGRLYVFYQYVTSFYEPQLCVAMQPKIFFWVAPHPPVGGGLGAKGGRPTTAHGLISRQPLGTDSEPRSSNWRSRRDSNPRYAFGAYNGLANRRLQPLGHSSASWKAYRIHKLWSNSGIEFLCAG